ncbi:DapA protein [Vibrio nigripulchritudo SOn1]|uniref:DapA protein n=1 Tax=Vibrio nigripulchritudo SOn1 TaxID=1238450 RepID=A0AAV2W011_9VIBR|nr:dihydrodipicolinate synthase family protein [Vibrio nigripulchritudo]CCO50205.1 DapA protein [Vibrio nigripulchritudo SOn1]
MKFEGVIPVMLTPYTEDGSIDYAALTKLTEWYIDNGSDCLFATCQSSEILKLSLDERVALTKHVVEVIDGRVPVLASGHISESIEDQAEELTAMHNAGADAVILITNRLDKDNQGGDTLIRNFESLQKMLPQDITLGLYECPAPYRRLLTDEEIRYFSNVSNMRVLKDVSCDLEIIKRRLKICEGTQFSIVNANAAIALEAMRAGSNGFSGVFNNIHPDLYAWLFRNRHSGDSLVTELATFLATSAAAEAFGYPNIAKMMHYKEKRFVTYQSRVIDGDIKDKFWAVEELLDHVIKGNEIFRSKLGLSYRM